MSSPSNQLALLARARSPKRHVHRWGGAYREIEIPVVDGIATLPGGTTVATTANVLMYPEPINDSACSGCGLLYSEFAVRQRRGRNNRKRGGGAELDVARTYGGEKVGPLGLPEDIRGKHWATQVKVSQRTAPPMWRAEFAKLSGQGRTPRLILRFARQGVKAEDYIVVRGEDWLDWFGRDE